MAFFRIHDGALTHPKVAGIFDPRRPLDLWLWGLAYAQQYLTDGHLPADALPRGCEKARTKLVLRRLWDAKDDGSFQIHDYGDWNELRVAVLQKRNAARARLERFKKRVSQRVENSETTCSNGNSNDNKILPKEQEGSPPSIHGRSKRPIFTGQRFTVFDWQLENLIQIFGPLVEQFDFHEWFFTLDAQAANSAQIIPKRDGGAWLEAQTVAEAQRRGLPIARPPTVAAVSKRTEQLAASDAEALRILNHGRA